MNSPDIITLYRFSLNHCEEKYLFNDKAFCSKLTFDSIK